MPAVDTKWVSQVWLRQSFREDGQPSQPVQAPLRADSGSGRPARRFSRAEKLRVGWRRVRA
eukprot:4406166-Prymnesium_polylepis.1